jgi:hypothetical protein
MGHKYKKIEMNIRLCLYYNKYNSKKQMSVRIEILFKEEASDHSGYCSGGECELTTRVYKKQVEVQIGEITNNLEYFEKYADEVVGADECCQSHYCDLGEDVVSAGLGKHDHRITILRVSLVDISKKRKQRRVKRDKLRARKEQERQKAFNEGTTEESGAPTHSDDLTQSLSSRREK